MAEGSDKASTFENEHEAFAARHFILFTMHIQVVTINIVIFFCIFTVEVRNTSLFLPEMFYLQSWINTLIQ